RMSFSATSQIASLSLAETPTSGRVGKQRARWSPVITTMPTKKPHMLWERPHSYPTGPYDVLFSQVTTPRTLRAVFTSAGNLSNTASKSLIFGRYIKIFLPYALNTYNQHPGATLRAEN